MLAVGHNAGNLYNYLRSLLHRGDRHKFITTVEVEATGENIGAGEALERELRSVGTIVQMKYYTTYICQYAC